MSIIENPPYSNQDESKNEIAVSKLLEKRNKSLGNLVNVQEVKIDKKRRIS
jgi:hypothetical protein